MQLIPRPGNVSVCSCPGGGGGRFSTGGFFVWSTGNAKMPSSQDGNDACVGCDGCFNVLPCELSMFCIAYWQEHAVVPFSICEDYIKQYPPPNPCGTNLFRRQPVTRKAPEGSHQTEQGKQSPISREEEMRNTPEVRKQSEMRREPERRRSEPQRRNVR